MAKQSIEWTRINNDVNGNSRHVCHFLAFIGPNDNGDISGKYELALQRARKLGGRKFHNKQYGGGIVFQGYSGCLNALSEKIIKLSGQPVFVPMSRRVAIVVKFHATNGNNDNRWSVTIRDFPRRYFDASEAEQLGIHGENQAEYFAEQRIKELKLDWVIKAAGTLPTGESVFTV